MQLKCTFGGNLIPKTKFYVCNLFWQEELPLKRCPRIARKSHKRVHPKVRQKRMSLNNRKAFQLEFGAYWGLARVLQSPSSSQNCRKKEKIQEKALFFLSAPNPVMHHALVQRDLKYRCILNYYPINSKTILWGNSELPRWKLIP